MSAEEKAAAGTVELKSMTLHDALKAGEVFLAGCGIEDARTDAWLLLEYVTGLDRTRFLLERTCKVREEDAHRYQELLAKRGSHVPLQHLTGEQEFMGLSFYVNEDVLIPRQDTEILVEQALERLESGMRILDLCTGSGCIAVSLARLGREAQQKEDLLVDAADLSEAALAVAGKNATALGAEIRLIRSDLFAQIPGQYHMIVSNPPYIPTETIRELSEEVRLHEPHLALDGSADGLHFYREIIRESRKHLLPGGWLLFEIGYDQGDQVQGLMEEAGYTDRAVIRDLAGLDRVVLGRNPFASESEKAMNRKYPAGPAGCRPAAKIYI